MLFVYRILINLILLISPLIIVFRLLKKKEDYKRFKEKFCTISKKKIKGKLIWFHGASVGEILSVIPIIKVLEKNKEIKQILVTSNTLSSSKILFNLKLKKTIHQFLPIDTNYHTKKFIKYWNPSAAIFIDSEIWPNFITNIKNKKIPLILLNARITKKSFKKWMIFRSLAKKLFQQFDICMPASLESKRYLKLLGAQKIKYIGNLKFSEIEKEKTVLKASLKKFFKSKKIWCASSTHHSEEKLCGITHKKLKNKYKNLLTIIIPRHVNRVRDIINEMENLKLRVHLHNSKKMIKDNTDIYLVNTYGDTKLFFKICKIIFLGGSIIEHGGQNPLEAARYGCKILHGPNISNFKEIYYLLNKYKVSKKIVNQDQMIKNIDLLYKNTSNSHNLELKIKNLGDKILKLTLKEVNFFINKHENK
ncbi:glycosyltransferase N-terminal domain-containing protein [Candidatus Pelagibacter sp.]|nr:glycosyltransferase N-terminal domain-containing protein [Candidatus Pelagibacter sp.]